MNNGLTADAYGTIAFWGNSAVQSYYGARTVFRYNNLTMSHVDQHGTPGMIGARWWEIYENSFYVVENGDSTYVVVRAGFPSRWGGGSVELKEEDSGYPALYQIGRGKNQVSAPAYVWGNDAALPVGSSSDNVQENRDYFLSAKPGYVPFTYPYPLTASGLPSPGGG